MTDAAYLDYLPAERAEGWSRSLLRRVAPVVRYTACSYSAAGAARRAFTEAVHAQLINRFLFSNLIEVIINLQLDTQTVMESDAYGDVDITRNRSMTR